MSTKATLAMNEARTRRNAERMEDIEWLASYGTPPDQIAERIGYPNVKPMYAMLRHRGELDLLERLKARGEETTI